MPAYSLRSAGCTPRPTRPERTNIVRRLRREGRQQTCGAKSSATTCALFALDHTVEIWLREEVASAYDALMDGQDGFTAADVRAGLASLRDAMATRSVFYGRCDEEAVLGGI